MSHVILAFALMFLSCSSAPPKERVFEGTVRENKAVSKPHFQRMSRWYLETADGRWDIYTSGHDETIAPYADKRVRIAGEAVESEIEGQHHREIRPSRVEPLD
ncbi:MAG: hypothetical protein QOI24_1050 [Acidobacteriota bacterium]|jgi:hypothetical protein|nr:hypothetical protein [Acidobacteriota bacterium]